MYEFRDDRISIVLQIDTYRHKQGGSLGVVVIKETGKVVDFFLFLPNEMAILLTHFTYRENSCIRTDSSFLLY